MRMKSLMKQVVISAASRIVVRALACKEEQAEACTTKVTRKTENRYRVAGGRASNWRKVAYCRDWTVGWRPQAEFCGLRRGARLALHLFLMRLGLGCLCPAS